MLDPVGIVLNASEAGQYFPTVASNGTDWFVTWQDARNGVHLAYGTRVSAAGAVLDGTGLRLLSTNSSQQSSPPVASNRKDYFVVWHDASTNGADIRGTWVTSTGTVMDASGVPISTHPSAQTYPAVASLGTDWLVVWMDNRGGSLSDIYGARVASNGSVLEPDGFVISSDAADEAMPAVGTLGGQALVTYQNRNAQDIARVRGRLVAFSNPAKVILNEILANEPGSTTAAEFVELVNVGGAAIDIGGWTVSDATGVRHTCLLGWQARERLRLMTGEQKQAAGRSEFSSGPTRALRGGPRPGAAGVAPA